MKDSLKARFKLTESPLVGLCVDGWSVSFDGGIKLECGPHLLLVQEDANSISVHWVLLGWIATDTYEIVASGDGVAGSLREPRHTWFGDNGYIFYVNPKLLTWAFKQLERWFDFPEESDV